MSRYHPAIEIELPKCIQEVLDRIIKEYVAHLLDKDSHPAIPRDIVEGAYVIREQLRRERYFPADMKNISLQEIVRRMRVNLLNWINSL